MTDIFRQVEGLLIDLSAWKPAGSPAGCPHSVHAGHRCSAACFWHKPGPKPVARPIIVRPSFPARISQTSDLRQTPTSRCGWPEFQPQPFGEGLNPLKKKASDSGPQIVGIARRRIGLRGRLTRSRKFRLLSLPNGSDLKHNDPLGHANDFSTAQRYKNTVA